MKGDNSVPLRRESHLRCRAIIKDGLRHHPERIDHDVADEIDLFVWDTLAAKVFVGIGRRCPEDIRNSVGDEAIDLFRHRPVAAAQPGLKVHDRYSCLRSHNCTRRCRVDVAYDDYHVWLLVSDDPFEGDHHASRLLGVRTAADAEVKVRIRQVKIAEESIRHVGVVVLPGMHNEWSRPVGLCQFVI